jgi:hypothetical protein
MLPEILPKDFAMQRMFDQPDFDLRSSTGCPY